MSQVDGRILRSQKSQTLILESIINLINKGNYYPTADQVAKESGIAIRTVFRQFADMESLLMKVDELINIKILKVLDIPSRRGPYPESLNFYEDITPLEIIPKKESSNIDIKFVERVGRPTKRERRQTDRLMGRD